MVEKADSLILVISDIRQITPRIRVYTLRNPHGAELPLFTAGAHLGVAVTINGSQTSRSYSICSNPIDRSQYQIAVLREDMGRGGSLFIHNEFREGKEIECSNATNNFHLHADASPAVFIAGGIGITPIIAMMHTLSLRGRRFSLHYAGRSKNEMAFVEDH